MTTPMGKILVGDCLESLKALPAQSVQCCVTSPPYWGLRDYGVDGQLGLEETPAQYIAKMVEVFREVKRVLRDDGVLFLNLGDSYAGSGKVGGTGPSSAKQTTNVGSLNMEAYGHNVPVGLKAKDLVGIPWSVAFALRDDGWYLRQDIIWHKPNPMPESVTDRCTKAHEYIFLLSKSREYFYDAEAIKEPLAEGMAERYEREADRGMVAPLGWNNRASRADAGIVTLQKGACAKFIESGRNRRSVWTIPTQSYEGAHFATYPEYLVEPCIRAGTSEKGCCPECGAPWERVVERTQLTRPRPNDYVKRTGEAGTGNSCANSVAGVDVQTVGWQPTCDHDRDDSALNPCIVLDPFGGSGTTGLVARKLGRDYIICELNPKYADLARARIGAYAPLFGASA